MANLLIVGGSRGLGEAFALGLPSPKDRVWIVSRTRPRVRCSWIRADLAVPAAGRRISSALKGLPLDLLLYNAGIWEPNAFSGAYSFQAEPEKSLRRIVDVNLTAAITCIRSAMPNLRRARHAKVVLIGSTSGLENSGTPGVAYTASKFGLRGLAHALRGSLRPHGIAVTCINPGEIAAEIPYTAGAMKAIQAYRGARIPVQDMVALVRCIQGLSRATCVKEIDLPAMMDRNA